MLKSKKLKSENFEKMIEYLKVNDELPTYDVLKKASNELGIDYLGMMNTDKSFENFRNEFSIIDTLESTMREAFEESFNGLAHVYLKHELIYSPSKDLDELLAIGVKQTITFELINENDESSVKTIELENFIDVQFVGNSIKEELFQSTLAFKGPKEIMDAIVDVIDGKKKINISIDELSPYILTNASMNVLNGLQTKIIKELLSVICTMKHSSDEQ